MLTKIKINSKFCVFNIDFYPKNLLCFCEQNRSTSYRNIKNAADCIHIKCKIILRKAYLLEIAPAVCVFTDIDFIFAS